MTSGMCVHGGGEGEACQKVTNYLLPTHPDPSSESQPRPPGAASGGATHETVCTRHFPPRGAGPHPFAVPGSSQAPNVASGRVFTPRH